MSDEIKDVEPVTDAENDDVYVLEDTGESLEDYSAASESPSGGDSAESSRLRDEVKTLKDQLLRSRADFDNFRKRTEREKSDYFKYAMSGIMREIVPVLDNFERALAADTGVSDDFRKGVELIYKQLLETLQKAGMVEVSAENQLFDPTMHEAVMREERDDVPSHTVLQVLQKGYLLHDRLIRPAMVKVAVGGPEPVQDPPTGDGLG